MLYTITVETKRTITYEVSANDEAEARDTYLYKGKYITSTETDRKIIDTEKKSESYKYRPTTKTLRKPVGSMRLELPQVIKWTTL